NCPTTMAGYRGAIRQDTMNRKVFFVSPSNTTEQLLYDFNMQVGDTVKGYIETFTSPSDTVKSIDSVLVGNSYRKRWTINTGFLWEVRFIEGIGSIHGLIEFSWGNTYYAPVYFFGCFAQNGQTLYNYSTFSGPCELITSIN